MTSSTVTKYKRHSTDMPLNINTRVLKWQEYARWSYRHLWIAFLAFYCFPCDFISSTDRNFHFLRIYITIFLLGYSENVTICRLSEFDSHQGYDFILSPPHSGRVCDDPNGYQLISPGSVLLFILLRQQYLKLQTISSNDTIREQRPKHVVTTKKRWRESILTLHTDGEKLNAK
jgi:hypothetical protein